MREEINLVGIFSKQGLNIRRWKTIMSGLEMEDLREYSLEYAGQKALVSHLGNSFLEIVEILLSEQTS